MANTGEQHDPKQLEKAADETREPEAAARVRTSDDAAARARQEAAAAGLSDAEIVLEENQSLLRDIGSELRAREQELARTGQLASDVAQGATDLRGHTDHTVEQSRKLPPSESKPHVEPGRRPDRED